MEIERMMGPGGKGGISVFIPYLLGPGDTSDQLKKKPPIAIVQLQTENSPKGISLTEIVDLTVIYQRHTDRDATVILCLR